MKKLRIGEIADLVGSPPSALRFWEEQGIVEPEKDASNNYRLYSPAESCSLLLIKRYRSFGFTLTQAREMLGPGCREGNPARFDARVARLDAEIARLSAIRDELAHHRDECDSARDHIGRFSTRVAPAAYYVSAIDSGALVHGVGDTTRRWMRLLPFVSYSVIIPRDAFAGEAPFRCRWGYGLSEAAFLSVASDPADGVEYVPERDCAVTAFERGDPGDLRASELRGILESSRLEGYEAAGPVIGHLLGLSGDGPERKYLYSLSIPINK